MAVIKSINKDVYKSKLYKRYDFNNLDNELKRWYESSKKIKDELARMDSWREENGKLRKSFSEELNRENDIFEEKMAQEQREFDQKPFKTEEDGIIFRTNMEKSRQNFNTEQDNTRATFEKKIKVYDDKINAEVFSNTEPSPSTTTTPKNDNTKKGTNDKVVNDPSSSSTSNPPSHTNVNGDPINNYSKDSNTIEDGNNNRDSPVYNSIDNNFNENAIVGEPKRYPTSTTLPLLCIFIIAIVAVACAAFYVIKKRKKARQFNKFDLKSNYESNNVQVVTDEQRIITDSIINGYVNDDTQPEGLENINDNGENQTANAKITPTNDAAVEDDVNPQENFDNQEDYAFTPQYSIANITGMENSYYPEGSIQVNGQSFKGKELEIDDFIPLMKSK